MTQNDRRAYLIKYLLDEQIQYENIAIPADMQSQQRLLRALMNLREASAIPVTFLQVQDKYLQEEIAACGITDIRALAPVSDGLYLWKGDITTLRCDAIVNAANSGMTGCYCPNHGCIDNAIHTYAGVQLRLACAKLMEQQGHDEPAGRAKITDGFNLPCRYVLHTAGPIIEGNVRPEDCEQLASCYHACLELACENGLESIAFCCISTGEYHFPNNLAAEIAVATVREYRKEHSQIEVLFNAFKDIDYKIYQRILTAN